MKLFRKAAAMKENLQESRPIDDIENEEGERKEEP